MIVSPIAGDSFLQWDPAQVSNYMSQFDRQVGKLFLDHNLDGLLLPYLTTDHLRELGIENLLLRLKVKRAISELIQNHYTKEGPANEFILQNANVNSSEVHIQSLLLAFYLIRETTKVVLEQKLIYKHLQQQLLATSPGGTDRKFIDNFNKTKPDLTPALKIIKEQKPLPTPTLDPGSKISKSLDSPTFSISSQNSDKDTHFGSSNGSSSTDKVIASATRRSSMINSGSTGQIPSPTIATNRFSSGSLLLMGTGKIIQQSVVHNDAIRAPNLTLQKIRPNGSSGGISSNGAVARFALAGSGQVANSMPNSNSVSGLSSSSLFKPSLMASHSAPHVATNTFNGNSSTGSSLPLLLHSNEPLKQLRASSDDSCLKVLQQAMKRHHIPRDDWLKYVLVICYGDKERILKLEEKPVIIFKELQELGKHPAIMLRQLAVNDEKDDDDDGQYEDSRIGEDIPGGTL